jgi:hypothetical protein
MKSQTWLNGIEEWDQLVLWRREIPEITGGPNGPGEGIYSYDDTPHTLLSPRPCTILATLSPTSPMPPSDAFRPRLPIDPFATVDTLTPWHVSQDLPHSPPQVILILGGAQSPCQSSVAR